MCSSIGGSSHVLFSGVLFFSQSCLLLLFFSVFLPSSSSACFLSSPHTLTHIHKVLIMQKWNISRILILRIIFKLFILVKVKVFFAFFFFVLVRYYSKIYLCCWLRECVVGINLWLILINYFYVLAWFFSVFFFQICFLIFFFCL